MGLGLLLSGLSGAGQATESSLADNQKLMDEQTLNQQRSDLDVQKSMLIAQNNKAMQMNMINWYENQANQNGSAPQNQPNSQPIAPVSPVVSPTYNVPSVPATTPDYNDATSTLTTPETGLLQSAISSPPTLNLSNPDISKMTPEEQRGMLPKMQADIGTLMSLPGAPGSNGPANAGFPAGTSVPSSGYNSTGTQGQIAVIKNELANQNNSPQDNAALQRELTRLQQGRQILPTEQPVADKNSSTVAPVSAPLTQQSSSNSPAVWTPSSRLVLEVMKANLINPGSGEKILEANAPDATGKMLIQMGVQPGSKQWNDAYNAALIKASGEIMRPGGTLTVGGKPVMSTPDADGNQVVYDQNGTPSIVRVGGADSAQSASAAASLAGKNSQTPTTPDMSRRDANGRIIPTTVGQLVSMSNQPDSGTVGLAPGQDKGAVSAQDEMSAKATQLAADNRNAQSTIANLNNIKQLAAQANVGGANERLNYINHLLGTYGIQGSNDMATANDLLAKNANQIIEKQGSGSTDAARAIIESANPNSHMTQQAINDAVDQLVGAQQMVQAKARFVAPSVAARDPVDYQKRELLFDQNADPRIFQYASMNAQQQAAYVAKLPPDQAVMLAQKRQVLRQMGAMQ